MLSIHVKLTLACLATTPLLWFTSSKFSRLVQPGYMRNRDLVDAMIQRLAENIRGISVVRSFAREQDEIEKFRRANAEVRSQKRSIFRTISTFTPSIGFLSQLNLVVLLGYGGYLVMKGQLPLGTGLVAFAGILQQFAGQVANIATIANSMQESLSSARRVFEVLDAPLEIINPTNPVRLARARGQIQFDHVWFRSRSRPGAARSRFRSRARAVRRHCRPHGFRQERAGEFDFAILRSDPRARAHGRC